MNNVSQFIQGTVLENNLAEHPAVQAWHALGVSDAMPASVVILKERKKKKQTNKSAVYRLSGLGNDQSSIVAKRCKRTIAEIERGVYQNVLPRLPLETLRYYGSFDELDSDYCWLFVEDAAGEPFSKTQPSHRDAAAKWLAIMHTSASKVAAVHSLPARDTDHYFEHLVAANSRITESLKHSFLGLDDRKVLRRLVSQLDQLGSKWEYVTASCEAIPRTLAHGDWVPKNLCVRQQATEATIFPFDWEMAGCGTPSPDLSSMAKQEQDIYYSMVRESWPDLTYVKLETLASFGKALRYVASTNWSAMSLLKGCANGHVSRPMCQLRVYADRLEILLSSQLQSRSCTHK